LSSLRTKLDGETAPMRFPYFIFEPLVEGSELG
jgi:hypothetical protein